MRWIIVLFLICGINAAGLAGERISLTIYDQGYGLVRETRTITLVAGESEITVDSIAKTITDEPIRFAADGVEPLEEWFLNDRLTVSYLLEKSNGKTVSLFLADSTWITGSLVRQPEGGSGSLEDRYLLALPDGSLRTVRASDVLDYRFGGIPAGTYREPAMKYRVQSAASGPQDIEIAYEAFGLNWSARYLLDLLDNDSAVVLTGWASLQNSTGKSFDNARLTLVTGQTRRGRSVSKISRLDEARQMHARGGRGSAPLVKMDGAGFKYDAPMMAMAEEAMMIVAPQTQRILQLNLYRLPRAINLPDKSIKDVALFPPVRLRASTHYEFAWWQNANRVGVYVEIVNTDSTGLGTPLPGGPVSIYKATDAGPEYVGAQDIGHWPVGETARIRVGEAWDIKAERKLLNRKEHFTGGHDEEYEVRLRSERETPVEVKIQDHFSGKWRVLNCSHDPKRVIKDFLEILITVPAEGEVVVTYTIRFKD